MLQTDFVWQVHERTIESDFLLIVLKSLLAQRSDLKYVMVY
jgi:ATP-dependent RNA helicase DHX29